MKKLTCLFLTSVLLVTCAFGITSCSEDATPKIIDTTTSVSYDELKAKVDAFDDVYAFYCFNKQEELQMINGEGFTPLGSPCSYSYITNLEGTNAANTVKSCTLNVVNDDGSFRVDEYFAVDASTLFVARTDVPQQGAVGTVNKYICYNHTLYEIDETNASLTTVEKPDTLDLYLDFSEIVDLYGQAQ